MNLEGEFISFNRWVKYHEKMFFRMDEGVFICIDWFFEIFNFATMRRKKNWKKKKAYKLLLSESWIIFKFHMWTSLTETTSQKFFIFFDTLEE